MEKKLLNWLQWSMDFLVKLSDEEGEAIFGMPISDQMESLDTVAQFFEVS